VKALTNYVSKLHKIDICDMIDGKGIKGKEEQTKSISSTS